LRVEEKMQTTPKRRKLENPVLCEMTQLNDPMCIGMLNRELPDEGV
jgi:hypothetical protein